MLQVKDCLFRQIVEENITKLNDVSQDEIKRLLVVVTFY